MFYLAIAIIIRFNTSPGPIGNWQLGIVTGMICNCLLTLLLGLWQCCHIGGDHLTAAQLIVGPYTKLVCGVGRQAIDLHLTLRLGSDYVAEMILVKLSSQFVFIQKLGDGQVRPLLTTLGAILMGSMRLHWCS